MSQPFKSSISGTIKTAPISEPIRKGMLVIWTDCNSNLELETVTGMCSTHILTTKGQRELKSLKSLVVEYQKEAKYNDRSSDFKSEPSGYFVTKQLPFNRKHWKKVLDGGLVDSNKEAYFQLICYKNDLEIEENGRIPKTIKIAKIVSFSKLIQQ